MRTFRVRLYGDDLSFLQAGLPATFTSDSTFTRFYPWYHEPTDTPDKLDAAALTRMGTAVVGADASPSPRSRPRASRSATGSPPSGTWPGAPVLWVAGIAALVPGLMAGYRAGGSPFVARMLHALLAAGLMWRHLVPALWVLVLPALISGVIRRRWGVVAAMLPPLALAALGAAAWARGMVSGVWLGVLDAVMVLAGLALLFVPVAAVRRACARASRTAARGAPRACPAGASRPGHSARIRREWTRCSRAASPVSRCRTSSRS